MRSTDFLKSIVILLHLLIGCVRSTDFLKSTVILPHLLIGCVRSTDFLRSIVISPQIDFSRWIAILLHLPNDLRLQ
ncbi:hypothetical protein RRK28_002277 [Staphylococcus pseudintermedius]|nr:hypothetical protein [Staphylococcus pseudintermedius]